MSYVRTNWDELTAITVERLENIEQGIADANANVESAKTTIANAIGTGEAQTTDSFATLAGRITTDKSTLATNISPYQSASATEALASLAAKVGTLTDDANALASQMLAGAYAYVKKVKVSGTMPDYSSTGQLLSDVTNIWDSVVVANIANAGYYSNSSWVNMVITNLKAANIKSGVKVGSADGLHAITGILNPLDFTAGSSTVIATSGTSSMFADPSNWKRIKEAKMNYSGVVRVSYAASIEQYWASGLFTNIFKNGSPVGTQRTVTSTSPTVFTEDIAVTKDDLIQIWGNGNGTSFYLTIPNFSIAIGNALASITYSY